MAKDKKHRPPTKIEQADIAAVQAVGPWLGNPLVRAVSATGKLGDEPPILMLSGATVAAGLLRKDVRLIRCGARMLAAHAIAIGAKTLGKNKVDRTRPKTLMKKGEYKAETGDSRDPELRSFPSGHTAGAFAVASAAAREYPGAGAPLYTAATVIGALQIPRKAHFPTDVIAGALVGIAAEAAVNFLWRRMTAEQ